MRPPSAASALPTSGIHGSTPSLSRMLARHLQPRLRDDRVGLRCGAERDRTFTVYVASPLFGKELADYYTPIFEKLGCKPVKCEFEDKKTACNCRHSSGIGRIGTEMLNEAYAISWFGGK